MRSFIAALALLSASMAHAAESEWYFKPYIGADYRFTDYGKEDLGGGLTTDDAFDSSLHGGNIHIGARLHENLGLELGYYKTDKGSKDLGGGFTTEVDVEGITLDALGYVPLQDHFELIGLIGVSYTQADLELTGFGLTGDEEEWQVRAGGGAQYWFTPHFNARGLVNYESADFDGLVDGAWVYSAGLNYQF